MSEPTQEQIKEAFEGTIKRWERIVEDPSYYHASDCQLCRVYGEYEGDKSCHKYCPIRSYGNHAVCVGTPHDAFSNRNSAENALAELNFLRKVYIWWMEGNEEEDEKVMNVARGDVAMQWAKKEKKEEWKDVTDKIEWELDEFSDGFLMWGIFGGYEKIVYFGKNGLFLNNRASKIYKIEEAPKGSISGTCFRILKKI